jgi:hypothetical protein
VTQDADPMKLLIALTLHWENVVLPLRFGAMMKVSGTLEHAPAPSCSAPRLWPIS